VEWNALKFFRADGSYLNVDEGRDLLNIYYSGDFNRRQWDGLHEGSLVPDSEAHHVERVLAELDVDLIRKRNFCVTLDCCNGAGIGVSLRLLRALHCRVEPIHCTPDGLFPHTPEPNFINLQDLCAFTKEKKADIGFATDPDADRVAMVAETGEFMGEELSLALAAECVLSKPNCPPGPLVTNMSTSRLVEDIAREAGRTVVRTPVGEVHVAERMLELGSPIGGEGNGGVMYPRVHCARDAVVGMGLILEHMARKEKTIGRLAEGLPKYFMVKEKVDCPTARGREIIRRLRAEIVADRVNTEDGIRLDWADRWVHLRASNTEPVLRIIAEAPSQAEARRLTDEYGVFVNRLL
jgi:phosphomannomutase